MERSLTQLRDEDLRAHVVWVDQLAHRLVGDADLAADAAQDAWVRALQRPPRSQDGLRAWLARVVSSVATDAARSRQRRRRREERVAGPESTPSTLDVVERASARQRVVQAVLDLEEPYRTTVLLRYLDELETAVIAEQTGASEVTVRKRISRGLGMLRARMGAPPPPGPLARALVGVPLVWIGDHWSTLVTRLGSPRAGGVTMAQTASSAGVVKLVVAVVAIVSIGFVGWRLATGPEGGGETAAPVGMPAIVERAATEVTPLPETAAAAEPLLAEVVTAESIVAEPDDAGGAAALADPAGGGGGLVVVTVDEAGAPVPGVRVQHGRRLDELVFTDERGEARLPIESGETQALLLLHPGFLTGRVEVSGPDERDAWARAGAPGHEAIRREIVLLRGNQACVAVIDERGAPIPGAHVRLRDMTRGVDGTVIGSPDDRARMDIDTRFRGVDIREAVTGYDGRVCAEGVRAGEYELIVRADGFVKRSRRPVEIVPGFNDLGLMTLEDPFPIGGRVVGPAGPVSGAGIDLLVQGHFVQTTTDDDGTFEILAIPELRTSTAFAVRHPDHDTWCGFDVPLDAGPLDIVLDARRTAELVLLDSVTGAPILDRVYLTREYGQGRFGMRSPYRAQHLRPEEGAIAVSDLETCMNGVLLEVQGYPRTWVPAKELLRAAEEGPQPILLEGEDLVVLQVTDLRSGLLLEPFGLSFRHVRHEDGVALSSHTSIPAGAVELFDPAIGGCRLDAQHLRLGPFADGTDTVSVRVFAPGYAPCDEIVLVEGGELVRSGVVPVALEVALGDG